MPNKAKKVNLATTFMLSNSLLACQLYTCPVLARGQSSIVLKAVKYLLLMNNSLWHHDSFSIKRRQNEIFCTLCKYEPYLLEARTIKYIVTVTHCHGQQQVKNDSAHLARPPLKRDCTRPLIEVIMVITTQIFLCATTSIKKILSVFCSVRILWVSKKNENSTSMEVSGEKQKTQLVSATAINASLFYSLLMAAFNSKKGGEAFAFQFTSA